MSAPAEILKHGSLAVPVLTRDRGRVRLDGLDERHLVYHHDSAKPGLFQVGGTPPNYPGLRIHEVEEETQPGRIEATLLCRGLLSGTNKRIKLNWNEEAFTWDTATATYIYRSDQTDFSWASTLSGFNNMKLVGPVGKEDLLDGRWTVRTLQYRGIKKAGLVSRRVTVNENIVQPGVPAIVDLINPTGWVDERNSQISMPRIVVTETRKTTSQPATDNVPGSVSVPISGEPFPSIRSIVLFGDDIVYNWPYGWKEASPDIEPLYAGADEHLETRVYEYAHATQF